MARNILFDLDGTLTDPFQGITDSIIYALKKMGIDPPANEALIPFIGPPLKESFIEYYEMTDEAADKAIDYYREYYKEKGIYDNHIYEGIPELLTALKEQGKNLYVATSKPIVFAEEIIRHFALSEFFDGIFGSELSGVRSPKSEVIAHVVDETGIDAADSVMIGDRKQDIVGAKDNGMKSIAVLFGYGTEDELSAVNPDHIAATVADLKVLLDSY